MLSSKKHHVYHSPALGNTGHLSGGVHPLVRAPRAGPADLPRVAEVVLADGPGQVERHLQLRLDGLRTLVPIAETEQPKLKRVGGSLVG